MTFAYMPFTYLPKSTARVLCSLLGPVTLYQSLKTNIPEELTELSEQGLVEIHTPIDRDNERMRSALSEFTQWAEMNPGATTAGADFLGTRQGEVPFFDESTINRIRSDINRYGTSDTEQQESELTFAARLFLSVAQENDRTTNSLDHDLGKFKAMEKDFLSTMEGADEARFNRQPPGSSIWQEDQGAKQTRQRVRSWAMLAGSEPAPEVLVTTSPAVMDYLLEMHGEELNIEELIVFPVTFSLGGVSPVLKPALDELARQENLTSDGFPSLAGVISDAASKVAVKVTLFAAVDRTPIDVIRHLATDFTVGKGDEKPISTCHTLFALVEV